MIDTTVVAVANGHADHVSENCVKASLRALAQAQQIGVIGIDDKYRIIREYRRYKSDGEPSPGDDFIKHIFDNMYNEDRCSIVALNDDLEKEFVEFPDDNGLQTLDRNDRKFVCFALGMSPIAKIVNSGDRGWRAHEAALAAQGVRVEFLCS